MKLLILLASVLAVQAGIVKRSCDGVYVRDKYFDKQLLKTGLDRPFLLAVDYETDTLYFNYNIAEDEYRSARYSLKTGEFNDIENIPNGFSHAVDSENNLLYIGTKNGIYVYNFNTDESEFFGAKDQFIWTLFFKDDTLFYSVYPSQEFYTYSNGIPTRFPELENTKVHYFVLDEENDMYFSNDTGLYKQQKGSDVAVLYKKTNNWDIRALTLDVYGEVYVGMHDGIYHVKRNEPRLEKVLSLHDVFGLTFDGDNNIIYADSTSVTRLNPNKDKKC